MTTPADHTRAAALDGLREILLAMEHSRLAIADQLGLNISDLSALSYVRSRGGIGQKDLATYLSLNASSITTLIDRLEAKNLVQRQAHPTDRRRTVVTVTNDGERVITDVRARYESALAAVPEHQIATATDTLTLIAQQLRNGIHA